MNAKYIDTKTCKMCRGSKYFTFTPSTGPDRGKKQPCPICKGSGIITKFKLKERKI